MKDQNCGYCMGGALLGEFGIPICELSVSSLILLAMSQQTVDK